MIAYYQNHITIKQMIFQIRFDTTYKKLSFLVNNYIMLPFWIINKLHHKHKKNFNKPITETKNELENQ